MLLTFTVLHDDCERVVAQEAFFITNNVRMVECFENAGLTHTSNLFFFTHAFKDNFFGDVFLAFLFV